MSNLRPFKSLYFGDSAAEDEADKWPELFLASFYDLRGAADLIVKGDAFLLIGPKGVGKSSYLEYLRLSGEGKYDSFVRREDLGELRGALKVNQEISESGFELSEMAWSVWIWSKLFDSLMADNGSSVQSDSDVISLHAELRSAGIVNGTFSNVISEVRKKKHKFTVPKFYEYSSESDGAHRVNLAQLRDLLVRIVCEASTPSTHLLGLDGLDSAEIGTEGYWRQLASLLRAVTTVHRHLRKARGTIRICMLCRSDVFLKIPIPDSNKIRQGWGVELEWSYGLETPEDSELWALLEHKASAKGKAVQNLVDLYFPQYMEVGQRTGGRRIRMPKYLIELTRNTPRDIIVLMKSIQAEILPSQELDVGKVRAGVNRYCRMYFAGEISNELVGMVSDEVSHEIVSKMTRLPGRGFNRAQFEEVFAERLKMADVSVDALLQQLYLAGAIANVVPGGGEEYVRFYHRRSYAELELGGPFIVHNALTLALGLKWARMY